jgi:hypothetical protein
MPHPEPLSSPRHAPPRGRFAQEVAQRALLAVLSWLFRRRIAELFARLDVLYAAWRDGTLVPPIPPQHRQAPHSLAPRPRRTTVPQTRRYPPHRDPAVSPPRAHANSAPAAHARVIPTPAPQRTIRIDTVDSRRHAPRNPPPITPRARPPPPVALSRLAAIVANAHP